MNDTPDRETMLDLVAAYALGVLPRSEQALVTAYILADSQARAEYEALRPVADLVGLAADEPVDSARTARMKQRLLATVNAPAAAAAARPGMARPDVPRPGTARFAPVRRNGSERSSWFIGAGLAAAAAVVFALVSTIQNFSLRSDLANANSRAASLQAQIAQNERVRIRDREMVGDLIATDAQRFAVPQGEVIKRGSHVYLTLALAAGVAARESFSGLDDRQGRQDVSAEHRVHAQSGGQCRRRAAGERRKPRRRSAEHRTRGRKQSADIQGTVRPAVNVAACPWGTPSRSGGRGISARAVDPIDPPRSRRIRRPAPV